LPLENKKNAPKIIKLLKTRFFNKK